MLYRKTPRRRGFLGMFGADEGDESVSASSPIVSGGFIGPLLPASAPDVVATPYGPMASTPFAPTAVPPVVYGPAAPTAAEAAQDMAATAAYYKAQAAAGSKAAIPAATAQPAAQASPWATILAGVVGAATARVTTKPPSNIVKTPPVSSTTSYLMPLVLIGAAALFLGPALLKKRA